MTLEVGKLYKLCSRRMKNADYFSVAIANQGGRPTNLSIHSIGLFIGSRPSQDGEGVFQLFLVADRLVTVYWDERSLYQWTKLSEGDYLTDPTA